MENEFPKVGEGDKTTSLDELSDFGSSSAQGVLDTPIVSGYVPLPMANILPPPIPDQNHQDQHDQIHIDLVDDNVQEEEGMDQEGVVIPQEPLDQANVLDYVEPLPQPVLRRSSRQFKPPRKWWILDESEAHLVASEIDEPNNVKEALQGPNSDKWMNAMQDELNSMYANKVWDLIDLPPGRKAIGNKWVLKVKTNADGSIERYKARLVAKGFTQEEGVDYKDTFSPVVKFNSIRLILAIVANLDLELHQMDVKTAFLNGDLSEEIYMKQPDSFVVEGQEHKVCRLKKSIYGLKQASRQWYLKFHNAITNFGFVMMHEDHCVYLYHSKSKFAILTLYVDDILMASDCLSLLKTIKEWLSSTFDMKDMGEAAYILGVKILRNRQARLLALSQESYIDKVLARFNMTNSKPMSSPLAPDCNVSEAMCPSTPQEKEDMKKVPYLNAIGSLMYAMLCTRPDISQAVGLLARYSSNPGPQHWKCIKRILRYLKGTKDYWLCYQSNKPDLHGYSDADWGGDRDSCKSTSGYIFLLNNGAISWSSKKQTCTALSTMEAEFVSSAAAVQEALWIGYFMRSLESIISIERPITIFCDSMAALAYTKDPKYHGKTKHIGMKYHFVRDAIQEGEVKLEYISTALMVADPLTKPLPPTQFARHVNAMGLRRL